MPSGGGKNPTKAVMFRGGEDEINLTGEENYVILDAEGRGCYVRCVFNVHNLSTGWWGEGDVMIFVDDEKWPPSFHGTGTEGYFCSSYGFPHGGYCGSFAGVSLAGNPEDYTGKWSVYRFHIEDPIVFHKSIKVTIEHGHANNRSDDYSSVAYWYQTEPHKSFPPMPKVGERLPRK
ncbi:MAG: glycoside hydrolase family 172 protein [Candidatus Bathyarchaeia archaeon]